MTMSFQVSDLRVDRIVESEGPFMLARSFFPSLSTEQLETQRASLEDAGALMPESEMLVMAVQSYVVHTPHHTILIDTCVGNDKTRPTRPDWNQKTDSAYMDALAAADVHVEEIDIVLCTHLHVDHVGWNTQLRDGRWTPTFPNARYLFGQTEYAHWEEQNRAKPDPVFVDSVLPVVEAGRVDFVTSDYAVNDHVRLLSTPGHTPGHVAALLGRGRDEAMVTGDLIHTPLQLAYPDLSSRFDSDPVQAAMTRKRVLAQLCETRMLCCTAHFPSPSVFRIANAGEVFRCEPAA